MDSIEEAVKGPGLEPVFPPELEQEIFEIVALTSPRFAPVLLRVAKRVRQWIEPRIYEVLLFHLTGDCTPPLYEDALGSPRSKRSNFQLATAHAKHVLLEGVDPFTVVEVLQSCVNVKNLMLWSAEHDELKNLIARLPVERLSVNLLELTGFNDDSREKDFVFDHSYFVNITHLDVIYIPKSARSWDKWKNLGLLPRLTHLSLYASTIDMVEKVLEECEKLELLVLIHQEDVTERGDETGNGRYPDEGVVNDWRVVQMPDRTSGEWIDDWIAGARGKEDFWLTAELMQRKKEKSQRQK